MTDHIESLIINLANKFDTHSKLQEMSYKTLETTITNISGEIKSQRIHFDKLIHHNTEHFDMRITDCHNAIMKKLRDEYVSKNEVEAIRDKTILEQSKIRSLEIEKAQGKILSIIKTYATIFVTTVLLLLSILGYMYGIKL